MLTYPYAAPSGTLTADEVHRLLGSPTLVSRRIRTLAEQRFIADFLLAGRFTAQGGAVLYEDGQPIFAKDDPESIAPGAEYPLTTVGPGTFAAAPTKKWGEDGEVYDETIARLGIQPVDKTLTGIVNKIVKWVDSVAMGVIGSRVTATYDSTALAWDSGEKIVQSVLLAKATGDNQGDGGYNMDTIALTPIQFAKVQGYLIAANLLPREVGNPVVTGGAINALGLTWTQSPWVTAPMLVDRDQLGGMADEDIKSPGYSRIAGVGIETKVIRLSGSDDRDGYRPRARRVTVPVVTDSMAAIKITNTGV